MAAPSHQQQREAEMDDVDESHRVLATSAPDASDESGMLSILFSSSGMQLTMVRKMLELALPSILGNVFCFSQQTLTQSYVGRRLGDESLAQYTVGISTFNIFGFSFGVGLACALDTLASQAYGRSQTNKEIGELLQRSILVDLVICVPLILVFFHLEPVLALMYGEQLASGAIHVLKSSWLYLPLNMINVSISKTLSAQNLPQIQLYASAIAAAVCWIACHFLINDSLTDAVLVLTLTHIAFTAALTGFSVWHPRCVLRYAQWPVSGVLWDWAEMVIYLKLGIPSLFSMCAEWWAFELLFVFAAHVSDLEVATLSVVLSMTSLAFSVALGVSIAGSVCIGNALGEGDAKTAKAYVTLAFAMDMAVTSLTVTTICLGRHVIPPLFVSDEVLLHRVAAIAPIIALFHWGDALQFTLQGVFRGAGKQETAAKAVMMSLWLVGLPMCWYLGVFHKLGILGILLGLIIGFCVEIPVMLRNCATWNWANIAYEASRSLDDVAHHPEHDLHPDGAIVSRHHNRVVVEDAHAYVDVDNSSTLRPDDESTELTHPHSEQQKAHSERARLLASSD